MKNEIELLGEAYDLIQKLEKKLFSLDIPKNFKTELEIQDLLNRINNTLYSHL